MSTIKDVAQLAGVSASCVSKYLKDPESVRSQNRKQIAAAIQSLNYSPSRTARALRYGKTMAIKAIMPPISLPYFAIFFEHLRVHFDTLGYSLSLHTLSSSNPAFSADDFADFDGALIVFPDDNSIVTQVYDIMSKLGRPVVVVSASGHPEKVHLIHVDMEQGIMNVGRFLLNNGFRRVSFVGGTDRSVPSNQRFAGFEKAIPADMRCGIYRGGFSMDWGTRAARLMLQQPVIPDAVICENDSLAAAIIKYMITHGVRVPEDMWVIGFDNIPMAQIYNPSISSISLPSREIATTAANVLVNSINGEDPETWTFHCDLVLRESTGHTE